MENFPYYSAFVIVHLLTGHLAATNTTESNSGLHDSRLSSLRRMSRQTTRGNGNGLIDEVIPMWKTWLQENGYDPLYVKAYDLTIDNFLVKLMDCDIKGVTTFKRTGDVTVNASEAAFAAEANFGLERLTLKCKTDTRWSIFRADGFIDADVAGISIEVSLIQIRPPPRVTALRITEQGSINIKFIGNGIVGTIFQWIAQEYFNYKFIEFLNDTPKVIAIVNEAITDLDIENAIDLL